MRAAIAVLAFLCSANLASSQYWYRPRHFDEYLSSLNAREQAQITGDEPEVEGSGDAEDGINPEFSNDRYITRSTPLRTGLKWSKDVACCSLGQLAGDKGYHCYVKFYAARIIMRNKNRAHNRKMGFHGKYKVPNYGTKLMRTFEQCVAGRGMVFNKCCHFAVVETKRRPHFDTWQRRRYEMKRQRTKARLITGDEAGL